MIQSFLDRVNLLLNGPKWNPAIAHGLEKVTSVAEVRITF